MSRLTESIKIAAFNALHLFTLGKPGSLYSKSGNTQLFTPSERIRFKYGRKIVTAGNMWALKLSGGRLGNSFLGKPIVLLNDGQTAGGYPKIATVVSADLPRLAALPAGATVRFQAVSVVAAEAAARAAESDLKALAGSIVPAVVAGELDLDALYAGNLLSGMVNATRPD